MSSNANFYIRPGANERIEVHIGLTPDERSAVHGVVRDNGGLPVSNALVMLFETGENPEDLTHTSQIFTDETGRFAFGPLTAGMLYMIKVYKDSVKLRELEITTE
ncbi:MAG: carboxypeptidase regulatory-like domain-containing protein [Oscillospiraceae bacterium]|nr:carboxypeptidase regulatory-like domain-containing protein [Oscillospiraceae bacterium]